MSVVSCKEFEEAAIDFVKISDKINDGWMYHKDFNENHKSYLKKTAFITSDEADGSSLLKTEYVIFYNQSYGVPSFSFNIWDSSGVLITLEKVRQMSSLKINETTFYTVITQQEHPIFFRPYFIVHPCHTAQLLTAFKNRSKNIIVTFLSFITPLVMLKLPLEYGC